MDGNTPIWQLTCDQFRELIESAIGEATAKVEREPEWARGLSGLADALGCGKTKAQEIKNSHVIDAAIEYCGKSYRVDVAKARELLNRHNRKR